MLKIILHLLSSMFRSRQALALENLALRHQLYVLQRPRSRVRLKKRDRLFWVVLSRVRKAWRKSLTIVQPETVIHWHRKGFGMFWRWKSRTKRHGRPRLTREERTLIHQMANDNPLWGAPHIHGELLKLGIVVGKATVSKYMGRRKPPSQTWRTFLRNHAKDIVSIDFFTVPTATFRVLYVLLVVSNARRVVAHFNVTTSPSAEWTGQQIVNAFPWDTAPRYLLRDRDGVYGQAFVERVKSMGIDPLLSAPRSPWQNPYVERLIGSVRRECLDHVIIFDERHLRRVLGEYCGYYNSSRTHLGLEKDCPTPRHVEHPVIGPIEQQPVLGGLHHRYFRRAA